MSKRALHRDYESRSAVDLKKTGTHPYMTHHSTDVWCMAYAVDDNPVKLWTPGEPCPDEFREAAENPNWLAYGHNVAFEIQVEGCIMGPRYGWPIIPLERQRCTMAMAYALALPGSLENAAAAVGLETRKDMAGRNKMLRMAKPRKVKDDGTYEWWDTPTDRATLYEYAKQDVEVERALEKRLLPLIDDEQEMWALDQRINRRGIHVDLPAIRNAIDVITETKKRLDTEMRRTTGGWVSGCTKVAELVEWLALKGVDTAGVAKADITELLDREDLEPEVRSALELRRAAAKSSTAKLNAMALGASEDGRCRDTMQYCAAGTGRWGGRRLQPQNLMRPDMDFDDIEEVLDLLGG